MCMASLVFGRRVLEFAAFEAGLERYVCSFDAQFNVTCLFH